MTEDQHPLEVQINNFDMFYEMSDDNSYIARYTDIEIELKAKILKNGINKALLTAYGLEVWERYFS